MHDAMYKTAVCALDSLRHPVGFIQMIVPQECRASDKACGLTDQACGCHSRIQVALNFDQGLGFRATFGAQAWECAGVEQGVDGLQCVSHAVLSCCAGVKSIVFGLIQRACDQGCVVCRGYFVRYR